MASKIFFFYFLHFDFNSFYLVWNHWDPCPRIFDTNWSYLISYRPKTIYVCDAKLFSSSRRDCAQPPNSIFVFVAVFVLSPKLIWFFLGQERFRSVTRSYFRRADGVMLLYDVTNERTFLSVRQWIEAVDVSFFNVFVFRRAFFGQPHNHVVSVAISSQFQYILKSFFGVFKSPKKSMTFFSGFLP